MISTRTLLFVDNNLDYNERVVNILSSESKKGLFEFKTFENVKDAFDEMKKNQYKLKTILVIIQGSQYPDYFEILNELKINKKLKFIPISFIYTGNNYLKVLEGKEKDRNREIKKEVLDSIGDKFYNPGGIGIHPNDIFQFIKNNWNLDLPSDKQEVSAFNFESCDDDIFLLSALIYLYNKKNILLTEQEIKDLNYILRTQHPLSQQYNDYLDLKYFDIDITTEFWINYYTSKSTFYQEMARDFNNNYFLTYEPFIKALYRALHKKNLKSKYDVNLYSCCPITKKDLENLENNLNGNIKTLIYTKQFQSFSQSEEMAKNYINYIDKDSIPVLYEVNKLEAQEAFASNIDIGDLSCFPENKEVLFFPYTCFIVEKIEKKKMKINSKNIEVRVIKLNYLGNYQQKINDLFKNLDEKKIESLLKNKNRKLTNYIFRKNKEEFPDMEENDFVKALLIGANIFKEKNRPKNSIEIIMGKKGKFISDIFYNKYSWILDIYFDDKLQDLTTNEAKDEIPDKIKIEINYPLYDIESMFYDCDCIKEINFIKFDTTHITSLKKLFSECRSLTKVNVEVFDTKNVTDMSYLFYNCRSLLGLDLKNFKLENVKDMSAMFYMCYNLKELNFKLDEINTKNLEDISCIFLGCHSLKKYDLLSLDIKKIKYKDHYI